MATAKGLRKKSLLLRPDLCVLCGRLFSVSFALSKTPFLVRRNIVNGRVKTRSSFRERRNRASQTKRTGGQQRDMTASSFILTLLLIATVAAASADHPAFWLLLGPAPFAGAVAAVALLRIRFTSRAQPDDVETTARFRSRWAAPVND